MRGTGALRTARALSAGGRGVLHVRTTSRLRVALRAATRMQSLSGRAHVVVPVLDVAEVAQGESSGARLIALRILGALRAQHADVFVQGALQCLVGVESRIEQHFLGLGAVQPIQRLAERGLLARRVDLRIDHHARLVGQYCRLVGRAGAPAVLELEQPRLGFAQHDGLGLGALGQYRLGVLDPGLYGGCLGLFALRLERFALDQRKARTHRLQHRSISCQAPAPGRRTLEHRLGDRLE